MADLRVFVGLVAGKTFVRIAVDEKEALQGLAKPEFILPIEVDTEAGVKEPPPQIEGFLDAVGLFGVAPTRQELSATLEFMLLAGVEIGTRIASFGFDAEKSIEAIVRSVLLRGPASQDATDKAPEVSLTPAAGVASTQPPPEHDVPTDRPGEVTPRSSDPGDPGYEPKGC